MSRLVPSAALCARRSSLKVRRVPLDGARSALQVATDGSQSDVLGALGAVDVASRHNALPGAAKRAAVTITTRPWVLVEGADVCVRPQPVGCWRTRGVGRQLKAGCSRPNAARTCLRRRQADAHACQPCPLALQSGQPKRPARRRSSLPAGGPVRCGLYARHQPAHPPRSHTCRNA